MILGIIGVLAAVLIPQSNIVNPSPALVAGGANMVASAIRYAQEYAMANRVSKSVTFASNSSVYTFSPTSTLDPPGQLPCFAPSQCATTTALALTFNSLGEPTSIPVGTNSVTLNVSYGGQQKTITVYNYTGKVSY
jgi:hypothetical protein